MTTRRTPFDALPGAGPIDALARWVMGWRDFSGRASRAEYWWATLLRSAVVLALVVAGRTAPDRPTVLLALLLLVAWSIATLVPSLALAVRRLRDAGLPPLLLLLVLVPWLGPVALAVLALLPSEPSTAPWTPVEGQRVDRAPTAPRAPRPPAAPSSADAGPRRFEDGAVWGPVVVAPPADDERDRP